MFERFTDKARRVLILAQEEAKSSQHSVLDTEHLLYGLAKVEDSISTQVLAEVGVTPERLHEQFSQATDRGEATRMSPPFTPKAKKALEMSLRTAIAMGYNYIGTEHLLLGMLTDETCGAVAILKNFGVDLEKLQQDTKDKMPAGNPRPIGGTESALPQLFNVVRDMGKAIRPDLTEGELNARAARITQDLVDRAKDRWKDSA
jgi:ATP-dependent Clp protease ATP-binding subunit ClpC